LKRNTSHEKRFTDEIIINVLNEVKSGLKVEEVCRKHGISNGTYDNWKAKIDGMTVSDAKKLKTLVAENSKLKRLVAEHKRSNLASQLNGEVLKLNGTSN